MPKASKCGAAFYLAAMIDGEGSVSHFLLRRSRMVRISNSDLELLEYCEEQCWLLGIACRVKPRYKRTNPRKPMYDLYITKRPDLQKVYDLIPFRSAPKRAKLALILSGYR